MFKEERHIIGS